MHHARGVNCRGGGGHLDHSTGTTLEPRVLQAFCFLFCFCVCVCMCVCVWKSIELQLIIFVQIRCHNPNNLWIHTHDTKLFLMIQIVHKLLVPVNFLDFRKRLRWSSSLSPMKITVWHKARRWLSGILYEYEYSYVFMTSTRLDDPKQTKTKSKPRLSQAECSWVASAQPNQSSTASLKFKPKTNSNRSNQDSNPDQHMHYCVVNLSACGHTMQKILSIFKKPKVY